MVNKKLTIVSGQKNAPLSCRYLIKISRQIVLFYEGRFLFILV